MFENLTVFNIDVGSHIHHAKHNPMNVVKRAATLITGISICALGLHMAYNLSPICKEVVMKCVSSASIQRSKDALYGSTASAATVIVGLYFANRAFKASKPDLPPRPPSK